MNLNLLIKSHKELKEHIAGKKILHLNSFGKDSLVVLEWLSQSFAEVVSINFKFMAPHPQDEHYLDYLKKRYPNVQFIQFQNIFELNKIARGIYQSPIEMMTDIGTWEYCEFSFEKIVDEMRLKYGCEYSAWGHSKYESVTRATNFYKKGLLQGTRIYPLGLWTKEQVLGVAKQLKLHPVYKTAQSTLDFPSWYKMKRTFNKYPEYKKQMYQVYPLLVVDEYRWTKLFKKT